LNGIDGFKELDSYMPMKIACESGINNYEIDQIGRGALYSPMESNEEKERLIFVETIDKL